MARKSPEHDLQVAIARALRSHCPYPWFAVPNGGHRHIRTAAKLKAEGVRRGVPDLCFVLPGGRFAGLELKAKHGRLSDDQKAFRDHVTSLQGWWHVANSVEEAWQILATWGCLPTPACTATSPGTELKTTP